jgi:hypothetical protein
MRASFRTAPAPAGAARFALRAALTCFAAAFIYAATSSDHATRDRPPLAVTGGFNETTCQLCHSEADVDDGSGTLEIAGVPATYTAGESYAIRLTLVHEGMSASGFEIAARFEPAGAQAGTLAVPDDEKGRMDVATEVGVQYAFQLYDGSNPVAKDTARWTIKWTAPQDSGAVIFHAVGNAANNDNSPLGDYIYTAKVATRRGP